MELFPYVDVKLQLAKKEEANKKGVADGYAGLDATGRIPLPQLPADIQSLAAGAERLSSKGQPSGYASLNSLGKVPGLQLPNSLVELPVRVDAIEPAVLPAGGVAGQVLAKTSSTDFAAAWVNQTGGGGGTVTWANISGKPAVIGAGSTAADARTAIGAADLSNSTVTVRRGLSSPYLWPARPTGVGSVLWLDLTAQTALDPPGWVAGDIIVDEGVEDLKGGQGDKGDKGDPGDPGSPGAPGIGVPTTGNQTGDLMRWNGTVWIQTATKFHEGTGNPNGVVTAPVGSTFVNTEAGGYYGASLWRKSSGSGNTGWTVSEGDTGVIEVPDAWLLTGWGRYLPSFTLRFRRVGKTVRLWGYVRRNATASAEISQAIFTLPTGFRAATNDDEVVALFGTAAVMTNNTLTTNTSGLVKVQYPSNTAPSTVYRIPAWSFTTNDIWPSAPWA